MMFDHRCIDHWCSLVLNRWAVSYAHLMMSFIRNDRIRSWLAYRWLLDSIQWLPSHPIDTCCQRLPHWRVRQACHWVRQPDSSSWQFIFNLKLVCFSWFTSLSASFEQSLERFGINLPICEQIKIDTLFLEGVDYRASITAISISKISISSMGGGC